MEYSNQILLQLLSEALTQHGAHVPFDCPPALDEALWQELLSQTTAQEQQALASIAEALRKDTRDFDCIDEIIGILEPLGYRTVPRHDFG